MTLQGSQRSSYRNSWLFRYGVSVVSVIVALALKLAIGPLLIVEAPFVLFLAAVMVSAWAGGLRAALLATALAGFCADYFFMEPKHTVLGSNPEQYLRLGQFVLEGIIIGWFTEKLRGALRASEESKEQFRHLVEGTRDYAMCFLDKDGRVASWNVGAERLTGYAPMEILGRHLSCFYTAEQIQAGEPARVLQLGAQEGRCESDGWRVRKDGSRFWADTIVTALRDPDGHLRGFSKVTRDNSERQRAEDARQRSEQELRAIVNHAVDAIITVDKRGIVQSYNPAAERIFGYKAAEIIGQSVSVLIPPAHQLHHEGHLPRYLETGEKKHSGVALEVSGRRKSGAAFPLDLAISDAYGESGALFTIILRDITERKELEQEVLEAVTLEQRRIGQDLHDDTGQVLTGISLMAESLVETLGPPGSAGSELAVKISRGLKRALGQVRAISRGLIPVEVDAEGLTVALQELADRMTDQSGVPCTFHCAETGKNGGADRHAALEDPAVATNLYRIAQEALTNTLKHSRARYVDLSLHSDEQVLTLRVQDDGVGIQALSEPTNGVGLRIMRYRAGLIGATLDVEPAATGGTVVTCTLIKGRSNGRHEPD
jgi:PAS domain S-box-containing protein